MKRFFLGGLKASYDLGPARILSSTNYSKRNTGFDEDGTDYLHDVYVPKYKLPALYLANTVHGWNHEKLFTEELRIASSGAGRFQYVAGLYYENYDRLSGLYWQVPGLLTAMPFLSALVPNGVLYNSTNNLKRQQEAAFGEGTLQLTDKLSLAVGARYFKVDLRYRTLPADFSDSNENGVSPRATLSYQAAPGKLLYATYSEGYRPGGPNRLAPSAYATACRSTYQTAGYNIDPSGQVSPYKSDTLDNYEVGAKTTWLERTVTANVSAYHIDWNNIQQLYFPSCGFGSTQNFGHATIDGAEFEYRFRPADHLSIFGGLNYNDAVIAQDMPVVNVMKGTPLQDAPKWTGNINGDVSFAGPMATNGDLVLSYRYVDRSYRTFDHSNPNTFQDSYNLLGARVMLSRGNQKATVFIDNILDQHPAVMNFLSTFGIDPARE